MEDIVIDHHFSACDACRVVPSRKDNRQQSVQSVHTVCLDFVHRRESAEQISRPIYYDQAKVASRSTVFGRGWIRKVDCKTAPTRLFGRDIADGT